MIRPINISSRWNLHRATLTGIGTEVRTMMTGVKRKIIADNKVIVEDMTWITVTMAMDKIFTVPQINTEEI
jgi:hypothetical protein